MKTLLLPFPFVSRHRTACRVRCLLGFLLMAISWSWSWSWSAHAAPPEFMTYQGFLVDANGNPLAPTTPANYPVTFRIYSTATGTAGRQWTEQQIVTVDKGNFSVILGEGTLVGGETRPALSTVLAGPNNADRYMSLSVTIGGVTSEMLPRLRLLPAPYAFTATTANSLVQPNGSPMLSYANSRVEVAGSLFASGTISGNGSGLTGLTASQIPPLNASVLTSGTLLDSLLSPNVARRDLANSFAGNQSFSGNVAINGGGIPLNFGTALGDKISLYGPSGAHYGFGIQAAKLQIHTDSTNSDVVFGAGQSAAMIETVRIKGTGQVGIGVTSPAAKLDVNGDGQFSGGVRLGGILAGASGNVPVTGNLSVNGAVRARGGAPGSSGINNNGYAFFGTGDNDSGMFSSADGQLEFYSNNAERLRVAGPRVGINTTSPRVPLDVAGGVSYTLNATQPQDLSIDLLDATGLNNFGSTLTKSFSILAEQHVGAVGFAASSDQRIKTDIATSQKERDLAAIQQLRVAEYGMVDTILHGTARRKGFIAQEVEKVLPQAVAKSVSFIPDVFVMVTNSTYATSTKTLTLSLPKAHELKVGDRVRLDLDTERSELKVVQIPSAHEFVVEGCEKAPSKVFVYGRQVKDFRTIDYDHVFTVGIGAMQELARKVEALEATQSRLTELEKSAARAAALDRENADLRARLVQQDQRLIALERLIQQKFNGVQQAGLRSVNSPSQP